MKDKIHIFLQKDLSSLILTLSIFVLSNIFFVQKNILGSNDFFRYYPYLILANVILFLVTAVITKNKIVRYILLVLSGFLVVFAIGFAFFMLWLSGMAKAFNNG